MLAHEFRVAEADLRAYHWRQRAEMLRLKNNSLQEDMHYMKLSNRSRQETQKESDLQLLAARVELENLQVGVCSS